MFTVKRLNHKCRSLEGTIIKMYPQSCQSVVLNSQLMASYLRHLKLAKILTAILTVINCHLIFFQLEAINYSFYFSLTAPCHHKVNHLQLIVRAECYQEL